MTCYLPAIKLVPRHSYTPGNLYPDGKNTRHASLITAVVSGLCLKEALVAKASTRSATPTKFYCRAVSKNATKKIGRAP